MNNVDYQTERVQAKFKKSFTFYFNKNTTDEKQADLYEVLRNSILRTFWFEILFAIILSIIADGLTIFYSYFIRFLIRFQRTPEAPVSEGAYLVVVFCLAIILSSIARNYYYYYTSRITIKIRKILISLIYDKTSKLCLRSLVKMNSGKLITMISTEIFTLERGLTMVPLVFAAPFVNIICYVLIIDMIGWYYAVSTFLFWLVVFVLQILFTKINYYYK